jgi:hypothetical protein
MSSLVTHNYTCKSCNNVFTGRFCNSCGEKVFSEKDKSLAHIFEEVFHFITHFEGSFFTTLKTFLGSPGKFSLEFCSGIRKKYFKPISFFLLLVILYLLFPKFAGLNMKLAVLANPDYGYSNFTLSLIKSKMTAKSITAIELAKLYDAKSPSISKIALFLYIPLSCFVLQLLFLQKRKPFYDNFILSTEISSFFIFSSYLAFPFLAFLVNLIAPNLNYLFYDGSWLWYIVSILFVAFISIAFINFYNTKWYIAIPKGLLFAYVFGEFLRYAVSLSIFYTTMLFL